MSMGRILQGMCLAYQTVILQLFFTVKVRADATEIAANEMSEK
jgi:hypothetical protein